MPTPSSVTWRPARSDSDPSDKYQWLPKAVREVYDRSGGAIVRIRDHQMFVREAGQDAFVFAGEAFLGSYGTRAGGPDNGFEACFSLKQKLPKRVWLEFGGYDGWEIELHHETSLLGADDVEGFHGVLELMQFERFSHMSMTRYEEDSLTIHTNPSCAWLMYLREPADCGLYTSEPARGEEMEEFSCTCGISLEFPRSQTVTHGRAMEVAKHYHATGELLDSIGWTEEA